MKRQSLECRIIKPVADEKLRFQIFIFFSSIQNQIEWTFLLLAAELV